jgi:CHASE2 domain-containing sensor protein/signal transduction histidine kinase
VDRIRYTRFHRLLLAVAGGLLCALIAQFHLARPLDQLFYDLTNEATPTSVADDVVIVAIDENSLLEFGRWPWPREKHVELIRRLTQLGAKVIAIDIVFSEADSDYPEIDRLLAAAIANHGAVVLPVFVAQTNQRTLREVTPVEPIYSAAAALGHVHVELDSDGVARSVYLQEGLGSAHWEHFAVAISRLAGFAPEHLPGADSPLPANLVHLGRIMRDKHNLIPFIGPAGSVDRVSYADVLRDRVEPAAIDGKIVIVGATAAGHVDNITTSLGQIPGSEINANILQALRQDRLTQPLPTSWTAALAFLFTALAIYGCTRLEPKQLLIAVIASILLVPLAAWAGLRYLGLWVSPVPIILSLILIYPLWNWLRLDAAFSFVRRQLDVLERENQALRLQPRWQDIERRARFLQTLGHLDSWSLEDSSDSPRFRWHHAGDSSQRCYRIDGEDKKLVLNWRYTESTHTARLCRVFPGEDLPNDSARPPSSVDVNLDLLEAAYREARHNRDLVKSAVERLSSGVLLADLSGEVLLLNLQAQELLGAAANTSQMLEALSPLELNGGFAVADLISNLLLNDEEFNLEGRSRTGGQYLLCRGRLLRLERPLLLIALTDISELKLSEQQRTEALNFLSHDLRAPMNSVLALIEGAKQETAEFGQHELLQNIESLIQRNLAYAENYVQLSRLAQTENPRLDECDIQSLLDNAVAQLYHAAQRRSIQFQIDYGDEDLWLQCNRSMMERALVNILDNALKFSPDRAQVKISVTTRDQEILLSVTDQGPGLDDSDINRLFEAFQQGDNARSGVGLGLRFVAAVAHSLGGEVSATNSAQGGAEFIVILPRYHHN